MKNSLINSKAWLSMPVWNQDPDLIFVQRNGFKLKNKPDSINKWNEFRKESWRIKPRNALLTNLLCIFIFLKYKRRANNHHWVFERTEKALLLSLVTLLFSPTAGVTHLFQKGLREIVTTVFHATLTNLTLRALAKWYFDSTSMLLLQSS